MPSVVDLKPQLLKITHDPTDVMSSDPSKFMSQGGMIGDLGQLLMSLPKMAIETIIKALTDPQGILDLINEVPEFFEDIVAGTLLSAEGLWGPAVEAITGVAGAALDQVSHFFGGLEHMLGLPDFNLPDFDPVGAVQNFIDAVLNPAGLVDRLTGGLLHIGIIPGLDASKIISGFFPQSMITGLESALAGLGTGISTGVSNIVNAIVSGASGTLDELTQWSHDVLDGDWMRQLGASLTGIADATQHDLENWAKSVRTFGSKIHISDIIGLPDLSAISISHLGKPVTSANLLSNAEFSTPVPAQGNWAWEGPQLFCFTLGGTGEPIGVGHASQVGEGIDEDLWSWVPVSYPAAGFPMINSLNTGIDNLVAAIEALPLGTKFALIGVSQGAVVTSKTWEDEIFASTGRLHNRVNDIVAAVTFGNPRRKDGSHAPGTPDPGGHGIATGDLQTNTPSWWYDYANPNDIVPTVPTGTGGDYASTVYDFLMTDWDGISGTLLSTVLSTFTNPLGSIASVGALLEQLAGDLYKSGTGHNPHTTYNTVKIDGTHTSVELATTYLDSVGAMNTGTPGTDFQDHTAGGSGSLYVTANGTTQEWEHPDLIAVTPDQVINPLAYVKASGLVATGSPIVVGVTTYLGTTQVAKVDVGTLSAAAAWTPTTGNYTIPAGVDGVKLRLKVASTATAGKISFDSLSLTKTGLLQRSHVNGLQALVSTLFGGFDTLGSVLQVPAIPGLDASKIISGALDALRIPLLDAAKIGSGLFDALRIPGLDVSKIISGVFGTGFIPALDASKITSGLFNALRIPNLPASIINSGTFLASLIPNLNAAIINAGTFVTSLIPALDASKITSGQFLTSLIPNLNASIITAGTFLSSLIPNLNASIINAGTFLAGLIPSLDASKITSGIFGTGLIPNITKAMSTDLTKAFGFLSTKTRVGPNIASNPDFENSNFALTGGTGLSYSTAQKHSGTQSLLCTMTNGSFATPRIAGDDVGASTLPTTAADVYYGEFWVYADAANVSNVAVWMQLSTYDATGAALATTNTTTTLPTPGTWVKMTGYMVIPANAVAFQPYLVVNSTATTGDKYYFDDVKLYRITESNAITKALYNANTTLSNILTSVVPALDASKITSGQFITSLIPNLNASIINAGTFLSSLIPNLNASIINAGTFITSLIPALDASKITSGVLGTGLIPNITKAMSTDIQGIIDNVYQAINGGVSVGNTLASVKAALGAIPGANIIGSIASSLVSGVLSALNIPSLDASKITSGQFLTSLIPNLNAAIINAGTFLTGLIPSLDASKITSGTLLSSLIPNLNASIINAGTFAANLIPNITAAMSSDLQAVADNIYQAVHGGVSTGNLISTIKTSLSNIPGANVISALLSSVIPSLDASKITSGTLLSSLIPNLNASIINAGTFLSSLIPNLNASIINAGTFVTGLIPALDASKITSGVFGSGLIPNITKAMSTDIQSIIDNVYQAINGGTAVGNTLASVKTALANIPGANIISTLAAGVIPALDATKIATGTFLSSLIPNLNASIINAGTFITSLIPSLDASKITSGVINALRIPDITAAMSSGVQAANNAVQSFYETVYNGVKGVPLIGATLANVLSGFQDLMTKLFATTVPQTTVAASAVPLLAATKIDPNGGRLDQQNIPDVQAWMSSDTQTIIDSVHQVANGGNSTGNPATSIVDNLTKLLAPPASPSTATAVTVESVGAGNQQNNVNSFVTVSTNWTHTIGATANMLVVAVVWESGPISNVGGTSGFVRKVLCGTSAGTGTPMTSILTSKGTYSFTEIFILKSPPSGAKVITATMNAASNYLGGNICDGVAGNSIALVGVGKIGALDVEAGNGVAMTQSIAANTNAIVVQGFASEHPSNFSGASITSYNKTSDYYSGNYIQGIKNVGGVNLPVGGAFLMGHAAGAASVNFTANESLSGDNYYAIAVAFFPSDPAPMGSTFRVYRASTTASTSFLQQTPTRLAASFFDTSTGAGTYITPDLTWDSVNNRLTAANAGSYAVTVQLSVPSLTASSYFTPVLYKNGVLTRQGATNYVPASANVPSTFSTTFQVYLNAGDYIEPGAQRSISTNGTAALIGDAAGLLSSFEVALTNRSLN